MAYFVRSYFLQNMGGVGNGSELFVPKFDPLNFAPTFCPTVLEDFSCFVSLGDCDTEKIHQDPSSPPSRLRYSQADTGGVYSR